jgi:hypothetical protein
LNSTAADTGAKITASKRRLAFTRSVSINSSTLNAAICRRVLRSNASTMAVEKPDVSLDSATWG